MIDLTPLDVRKKRGDFRRILRGYDPEEVDTFMDLVAERFEELVRENLSLGEKTERIGRQLEALEGRENAVQEALVTAQKLREEVGDQSRRDAEVLQDRASRMAELLKAEAEAEIQRRLGEAEGLIRERQRALEDLERSRLKFLKSFRGLLEREMDSVDVEESRRPLEETPLELEFRGWMPSGDLEFGIGEDEFEEDEAESEESTPVFEDVLAMDEDPALAEEAAPEEAAPEEDPALEGAPGLTVAAILDEAPALEEALAAEEAEEPVIEEMELADRATPESEIEAPEETEAPADEPGLPEAEEEPQDPWAAAAEFPTAVLDDAEGSDDLPTGFETQILEGAAPASFDSGPEAGDGAEPEDDPEAIPQEPRWLFSLLKKDEEKGGEV